MFQFFRRTSGGNKTMIVDVITEESNWTPKQYKIKTEEFPILGGNTQFVITHTQGEQISITGYIRKEHYLYMQQFEHDYCWFEDPDGPHYVYIRELVRNSDDQTDYCLIGVVMEVVPI